MGRTWTEEQKRVIDSRGRSLLVSAAAGSGKTAVLVERILKEILDPERPIDLDRLLIVTFTRAATAQLRERIREAVTEKYDEDPSDPRLQHQMSLLHCDHIMTIDRFFLMVIREHYEEIGLDPSFRIGDEGELKLMRSDVVGDVLEEEYEKGQEDFLRFSENYAPGNSDKALEDMVLNFWESSMSHAFPKEWRHDCLSGYRKDPSGWRWLKILMTSVKMYLGDISDTIGRAKELCSLPGGPKKAMAALLSDDELLRNLMGQPDYDSLMSAFSDISFARMVKKPAKGEPPYDPGLTAQVYDLREGWKKQIKTLAGKYFCRPLAEEAELMRKTGKDLEVLVRLADRFEEAFHDAKVQKNILDFYDTSHLALQVLLEKGEDGSLKPTRAAKEYQDYFEEISIDEYQDSNEVQELLLSAVSKEGRGTFNRFMVGDVKQSIYRFRMSDPGIFMQKYDTYSRDDSAKKVRIDLHKNFRSREQVLSAVNLIFRQIMRKDIGGIEYGEEESLVPGAVYPKLPEPWEGKDEKIYEPELIIVEPEDLLPEAEEDPDEEDSKPSDQAPSGDQKVLDDAEDLEDEEDAEAAEGRIPDAMHAEAEAVAQRILQMAGHDPVWDKEKGEYRTARFSDIVILLRTSSNWANAYTEVLSEHGIPSRSGSKTGYFSAPEVKTILAYLNVLDNPRQDIPLAAVLRSEIGGLTDDELAMLKTGKRRELLFDCITDFLEAHKDKDPENTEAEKVLLRKLNSFSDMTSRLRDEVSDTPIHQLLWNIYDETGFESLAEASPGGRQKKANLDMLVEKAIDYEKTSYRGLFHFVRYIDRMRKYEVDFGAALEETGDENLVRIMTIHASKGLEFPIVFVSGLGKKFNTRDASAALVKDPEIGIGMNYVDPDRRVQVPTLIRSAASERTLREGIGEELRILYVAMTRAEEKLILTGCVKSREEDLPDLLPCSSSGEEKLPGSQILRADNFLFWVMASLVRHPSGRPFFEGYMDMPLQSGEGPVKDLPGSFRILTGREVIEGGELTALLEETDVLAMLRTEDGETPSPGLRRILSGNLGSFYPFPDLSKIPAKVTVSELKRAGYEAEMERLAQEADELQDNRKLFPKEDSEEKLITPDFMRGTEKNRRLSGTETGTAYHRFLADFDFTSKVQDGAAAGWLETMVRCDKITEDERNAVSAWKLDRFLHSELAGRMHQAAVRKTLHRENPFVLSVRAGEIYPDLPADSTDAKVLIQGTIDAWFEDEDGKIVLIDYKTDRVKKGQEDSLVRRYRRQFLLYGEALLRLTGREVKEAFLYSLQLGRAIPVDLKEKD